MAMYECSRIDLSRHRRGREGTRGERGPRGRGGALVCSCSAGVRTMLAMCSVSRRSWWRAMPSVSSSWKNCKDAEQGRMQAQTSSRTTGDSVDSEQSTRTCVRVHEEQRPLTIPWPWPPSVAHATGGSTAVWQRTHQENRIPPGRPTSRISSGVFIPLVACSNPTKSMSENAENQKQEYPIQKAAIAIGLVKLI